MNYLTLIFSTYDSGCVNVKHDIWDWHFFQKEVFKAGICWRVLFVSCKHFHLIESYWIKKWNIMNEFPINCNSIKNLKIKKIR